MTTFAREKIRMALHHSEDGLHQALLDITYDEWQKHKGWSMEDMLQYASSFGEVVELAVLLGKYNQQVNNGGHTQYFDNGYGGTHNYSGHSGDYYNFDVPLARRMEELLVKYKLNETTTGKVVTEGIEEFINRTHSWDPVSSDEIDEYNEDDVLPDYEDLDDKYYKVNEDWNAYLEKYLKSWMEFNEDPIAAGRF